MTPKTGIIARYMLIFAMLQGLVAKPQLTANFSASPISGCAPMVVNFTDLSTGNPTEWKWDLGNNTNSILQNPSVTYFNPGTYTIKLIIKKPGAVDSIIKNQFITVYSIPTVEFNANPLTGCYPLPVTFTNTSTAGSGIIDLWQWDFGDGASSNNVFPVHSYNSPGNFNVSLRARNSHGCIKTITKNDFIKIMDGVKADFTSNITQNCQPPTFVQFQNLSAGTSTIRYSWNFGDGASSTLFSPGHNYINPGTYSISLVATHNNGCADTITKSINISGSFAQANFIVPPSACMNTPINFRNTSNPLPQNSYWSFGDGTTSILENPVKNYSSPGTYVVKLISNFGTCRDTMTRSVNILAKPVTTFQANLLNACKVPFSVDFVSQSNESVVRQWSFGDGSTSSLTNPTHNYSVPGNHTVTLMTQNANGCADTLVRDEYIKIKFPDAGIISLPTEGCAPLSKRFSSSLISTERATSYLWDFGDGTTSTASNPTHVFSPGIYTIRLIIRTASGCTDTVVVPEGILAGTRPTSNFAATPREACAEIPVNFQNLSTGNPDKWLWKFGDGGTSTLPNPSHQYQDTGYFGVTLYTWNRGCLDSIHFANYIHITPPVALFEVDDNCNSGMIRNFKDKSIEPGSWFWDFGDGNTSVLQNPIHTYANPGDYTVLLKVTGLHNSCEDEFIQTLHVVNQAYDFSASQTLICKNSRIIFSVIPADTSAVYKWDFGDGKTGIGNPAYHTYLLPGLYPVRLIVTKGGICTDTVWKNNYIEVAGPTANFMLEGGGTCAAGKAIFRDSSSADPLHNLIKWIWDFGDGITDTLFAAPHQHVYAQPGVYSVSLIVTDNAGCSDTSALENYLTISKPLLQFSSDTLSCPNHPIQFLNNSIGTGLHFLWDFGDGEYSAAQNPSHAFPANGMYSIKLFAEDMLGCKDSIIYPDFIKIVSPEADFSISDSISTCAPLVVNFQNASRNALTFQWEFGDGTSTPTNNPTHFYSSPGNFTSKLTVWGPGGCTSVKQKVIKVKGATGTFRYGAIVGCSPFNVNFIASSPDEISFIWDFNDGSTQITADSTISHTYATPGNFIPKLILLDSSGCMIPIPGTDTIVVDYAIASFQYNSRTLCDSGQISFNNLSTGSSTPHYEWDFGDGTHSTEINPVHYYNSPGTYFTKLMARNAVCADTLADSIPVIISSSPVGNISKTADGCAPLTVTFKGMLLRPDTSALSWSWKFGNGNTSHERHPPPQHYAEPGNFPVTLWISNYLGCKDTVYAQVQTINKPVVSAGNDVMTCQGTPNVLRAEGALNYSWTPGTGLSCTNCASPVASPDTTTRYYVKGTTLFGCSNIDSLLVTVTPKFNLYASRGDTLCVGKSIQLHVSGASRYTWSPSTGLNNATANNPIASPQTSTVYRVIGTDAQNCFQDTAYIPVVIYPIPLVDAGPDQAISAGQTIELTPVVSPDVSSVKWSPATGILHQDHFSITVRPTTTTQYLAEASNPAGCITRDLVTLTVTCSGINVFIPNTFSPNGDGMNDLFYPRGTGLYKIKTARIFDRWGEMVYSRNNFNANDPSAGWDGTYKGLKLNPDVYVYIMEVLCDNNTVLPLKGNVALIK